MAKQAPPPPAGGLLAKYGQTLVKAVETHKNDETTYSNVGGLPAGLDGVAELTECKFGIYGPDTGDLKGHYFFMGQASILTPKHAEVKANVVVPSGGTKKKIAGSFTKIGPEPLCDTPSKSRKTTAEHVAWILNELRKLGAPPAQLSAANLESLAAAIKKSKPTFSYRTYKFEDTKAENRGGKWYVVGVDSGKVQRDGGPYPSEAALKEKHKFIGPSRVNETWGELCERPSDDEDDGVTVGGEAAEAEVPEVVPADDTPTVADVPAADVAIDYTTETDLDVLAAAADGDSESSGDAQERLTALAVEAGCDISAVETWTAGAEVIKAAQANGSDTAVDVAELVAAAEAEDEASIDKLRELWEAAGNTCDDAFDGMSWSEVGEALEAGGAADDAPAIKVKDCGSYKPTGNNPKTKKPYKDPIDCEVTAVNANGTLDLLSMIDRKTVWKGVPVAEFTPVG